MRYLNSRSKHVQVVLVLPWPHCQWTWTCQTRYWLQWLVITDYRKEWISIKRTDLRRESALVIGWRFLQRSPPVRCPSPFQFSRFDFGTEYYNITTYYLNKVSVSIAEQPLAPWIPTSNWRYRLCSFVKYVHHFLSSIFWLTQLTKVNKLKRKDYRNSPKHCQVVLTLTLTLSISNNFNPVTRKLEKVRTTTDYQKFHLMNGPMEISGRLLQRSLRRPFRGSNGILTT